MKTVLEELNIKRCNMTADDFIKWLHVNMKELLEEEKQMFIDTFNNGKDYIKHGGQRVDGEQYYKETFLNK